MKYILVICVFVFTGCDIMGTSAQTCKQLGWKGLVSSSSEQYCSNGDKDGQGNWITNKGIQKDRKNTTYHYIPFGVHNNNLSYEESYQVR